MGDVQLAIQLRARGIRDERVLAAIAQLDRSTFVPEGVRGQATEDHPLPIGFGQTISQPYVVAYMTEALGLTPSARVLEIGTGSGYQAAVLALLSREVFTIEVQPALAKQAAQRLAEFPNVHPRWGDGFRGWPERAPFDAILLTAAPAEIPPALVSQLAMGGRLVAPVGAGDEQTLVRLTRTPEGLKLEHLLAVRFVPMVAEAV